MILNKAIIDDSKVGAKKEAKKQNTDQMLSHVNAQSPHPS